VPTWTAVGARAAGRLQREAHRQRPRARAAVDGSQDPNTAGSEDDIKAQTAAMLEIRDVINDVARMINQAESIRAQITAETRWSQRKNR
jgi:hypothetical protein